jgi:hypothetical protein
MDLRFQILGEIGNKNEMMLNENETEEKLKSLKHDKNFYIMDCSRANIEATKGNLKVYDSVREEINYNRIYKNTKGFYIKKHSKKIYLENMQKVKIVPVE